jgi:hypothetical protein
MEVLKAIPMSVATRQIHNEGRSAIAPTAAQELSQAARDLCHSWPHSL